MKLKHAVVVVGLTICAVACSNDSPVAPITRQPDLPQKAPLGVFISDAHSSNQGSPSTSGGARNVVYVSAQPGTFPLGAEVLITNSTRSAPAQTIYVVDGGFDPKAIEGEAADNLVLTVSAYGVSTPFSAAVPSHAAPVLVRADPSTSRVDVALDAKIHLVFSEPLDSTTVNASSVALYADKTTLAGTLSITAGGCEIVLIPDGALAPETKYSVSVTSAVRDLDGDALDQPLIASFVTADRPINGDVVFQRPSDHQIYVMTADGSSSTRLTSTADNFNAVWSPDGKRIAFARNVPGSQNNGWGLTDIYTMAADGTDLQRRTVNGNFYWVTWSPDGKTLAISDGMVYYGSIFLIKATGDIEPPSFLVDDASAPAWSPDGKQIAYVHLSHDDGYNQVYVVNPDGTNPKPLTEIDPGGISGVSWSPDGTRLAFSKCMSGDCGIYTMDNAGGSVTRITDGEHISPGAWSPDGQRIAFTIHFRIASVSADGGRVREMSDGIAPSWHP